MPSKKARQVAPGSNFLWFLFAFLLLLIINGLPYHLLIEPNGINTITIGPEVIAPIGALFQIRKLLEYLYRCSTLYCSHELRYGNHRNFGTHTMWYWQCYNTCDNFINLLICCSFLLELWGQQVRGLADGHSTGKANFLWPRPKDGVFSDKIKLKRMHGIKESGELFLRTISYIRIGSDWDYIYHTDMKWFKREYLHITNWNIMLI